MKWRRSFFRIAWVWVFLVACNGDSSTNSSGSGSFSSAGPMLQARMDHSATLLADGRVLIVGGVQSVAGGVGNRLIGAELYDPAEGRFRPAGTLPEGRTEHVAALLEDGRVLIAGGGVFGLILYEPASGTFVSAGVQSQIEVVRAAVRMEDGRILLLGDGIPFAEFYDPATGELTRIQPVGASRVGHSANLLNSGEVLIAGGGITLAERYDPEEGLFLSAGRMEVTRFGHRSVMLPDGRVLIVGGSARTTDGLYTPVSNVEVFDPATRAFSAAGNLGARRFGHTATLLNSGEVLVVGGAEVDAEIYNPETQTPRFVGGEEARLRTGATATRLQDGRVLIAGGLNQEYRLRAEALLYNP